MLNAILLLLLYRGSCIGGSSSTKVLYYIITHQFIPRTNEVTVNWEVSLKLVHVYCLVIHFEINQDQLMLCGMWR